MVFIDMWSLFGGYIGLFNQGRLFMCDIYLLYSEGILIQVILIYIVSPSVRPSVCNDIWTSPLYRANKDETWYISR